MGEAPLIAILAATLWGVLSLILSPCHLAGLPLVVGFVTRERGGIGRARALGISLSFALGTVLTIGLIGVVTSSLGMVIGSVGGWINYLVALVFFAVGLHLLGAITLPLPEVPSGSSAKMEMAAPLLVGLVFGLALGPCTFAYLAPVMAAGFAASTSTPVYGFGLLIAFAIGHCGVIVIAGTSAERVQRLLEWNDNSRTSRWLRYISAILVIIGGLYLVYLAP